MKRFGQSVAVVAVAVLAMGAAVSADEVTLEGQFVWERTDGNHSGDIKAVFTPAGDGVWDVAFHFDWEDGPHVYRGTAKGSLSSGELSGEVENDNEERKARFKFSGTFADGKFEGTHAAIHEDGTVQDTGKLTLGPAS